MVTKHTQFVKSIQATFHSCSQDTYLAASAVVFTLWVAETAKLRLDWSQTGLQSSESKDVRNPVI